jgi:hypothetical protein
VPPSLRRRDEGGFLQPAATVEVGGSQASDGLHVDGAAVTLVAVPAIGRRLGMTVDHETVAVHLGNDGCGGDRRAVPVGFDTGHDVQGRREGGCQPIVGAVEQDDRTRDIHPPAVEQAEASLGGEAEARDDAEFVDLLRSGEPHSAVERPLGRERRDPLPRSLRQHLRIAQAAGNGRAPAGPDDAQAHGDGAGQRAAPDLVDSDDETGAPALQAALYREGGIGDGYFDPSLSIPANTSG